jgi:2-alkenal reductase
MMLALPATTDHHQWAREVRLRTRPKGLPGPEHFEVVSVPKPVPQTGEVLVRNRFFRVSASIRMMISEGAEAVEGVPFPALSPGDTLAEEALGEVVSAPPTSGLSAGDLVLHRFGFRDFAVMPANSCAKAGIALRDPVAHLGHGWTAYAALTRGAPVRPGDTVFVSSAAGAIGSMAAFIAHRLGARRVIGSTSSQEKAGRLRSELGYDRTVVRGAGSFLDQLREAAPEGIDVVLDTVGGEQLRAAVMTARRGARLAIVGALSGQLAPQGAGRTAPVELDSFPILLQRITVRGYSADDDPDAREEWNQLFGDALRAGETHFPHIRIHGIERAPNAICEVIRGQHLGTALIEV